MNIVIATVQVPFIRGGAEILSEMLCEELNKRGHHAEIVAIPFNEISPEALTGASLRGHMLNLEKMNGEAVDLVIALKFPAYYVKHPNKVIWLLHQYREAYDLWETKYSRLQNCVGGQEIKKQITEWDTEYLGEAKAVYTIAANTSKRLKENNQMDSEVLYHPPMNHEKLYHKEYGDYVFFPSRIHTLKRQRILVEAARYTASDVKIVIAGTGKGEEMNYIISCIEKYHLEDKVKLTGYITEQEKIDYYAGCLAVYFGAYDEDYGYITLEGFFSHKPLLVHSDAGGPLEFVKDGVNGYVLDTNPQSVAKTIDDLYKNRDLAAKLGEEGYRTMIDMNVSWDHVIEKLIESSEAE